MNQIKIGNITIGGNAPFILIAGPCVIEDEAATMAIAGQLKAMAEVAGVPLIFKASYDKANRTSIHSFRGPGLERGLAILARVKGEYNLPLLTDVHTTEDVAAVACVVDVIQIPAFLCRQTDLLVEAAREAAKAGSVVNIKKGQFLAPWDMKPLVEKARSAGNGNILLTERGATFGYNNLVVDFRSIPVMRETGCPVIFDATHSVQLPGGRGDSSGGEREMAPCLARAAVAVGVDGLFLEVHPDPDRALSDGANSLSLDMVPGLLRECTAIDRVVKRAGSKD
ncbi:MAG: 3-deoxy-8-phosphooctulonate synthase [Deltaproteobacteria bacterium]|nr:3-deoxy-8-phosphooctulonate synthase [Deltaproteobacteria bacterium]